MVFADQIIEQLYKQLGANTDLLRYLPLHKLIIEPLEDKDSVDFKILFGHLSVASGSRFSRHAVLASEVPIWLHFYPATRPDGPVQITFNEHTSDGSFFRHDMQNMSKKVLRLNDAFAVKESISREKAVSLARYYFLVQIANNPTLNDELLHHGMPLGKSFLSGLLDTCILSKDTQRTMGPAYTPNMIGPPRRDSAESALSSVPSDLTMDGTTLNEATCSEDQEAGQSINEAQEQHEEPQRLQHEPEHEPQQEPQHLQHQPEHTTTTMKATMKDTMKAMIQVEEDKTSKSIEITAVNAEIDALNAEIWRCETRRNSLERQIKRLERDQADIRQRQTTTLAHVSREEVYEIGFQIAKTLGKRKREH